MQSFDRAQHGNRRSDHPIGIEERSAEQPEQKQVFPPVHHFTDQRREGENAALAPVIGAQDEDEVFDRNDEEERPKDEREHPKDVGRAGMHGVLPVKALAQGVKWTRADVAVNDPEAGEAEQSKASLVGRRFRERRLWPGRLRSYGN